MKNGEGTNFSVGSKFRLKIPSDLVIAIAPIDFPVHKEQVPAQGQLRADQAGQDRRRLRQRRPPLGKASKTLNQEAHS
jgi:hypothetical protein